MAQLMTDAVGAAEGVKREVDTVVRAQAEKILADLDLVRREEFDAVRDMAAKARAENETLSARLEALEQRLAAQGSAGEPNAPAAAADLE
jgi:BMFP domain-containing protein YqiC